MPLRCSQAPAPYAWRMLGEGKFSICCRRAATCTMHIAWTAGCAHATPARCAAPLSERSPLTIFRVKLGKPGSCPPGLIRWPCPATCHACLARAGLHPCLLDPLHGCGLSCGWKCHALLLPPCPSTTRKACSSCCSSRFSADTAMVGAITFIDLCGLHCRCANSIFGTV